jgi:RNA polymerase primary sigma factor
MQIPERLIEAVNRVVRTSRRLFLEQGREPSSAELAERLQLPLDKVEKLLTIARTPIGPGSLTQPR